MEECYKLSNLDKSEDIAICNEFEDITSDLEDDSDIYVYPVADLPLPYGIEEKQNEIIFLDPSVGEGKRLVNDKTTTIPELFALMRQFIVPVCGNIGIIVDEMLRRGVGANDIDSTTGMSMLHYAIRASVLSEKHGLVVVKRLLMNGADPSLRCLHTDMNALHVATYFNVAPVIRLLLKTCEVWLAVPIDSLCSSFEYGTSLHIGAKCLSCEAVEILLQNAANSEFKDDIERVPEDCIPSQLTTGEEQAQANRIRKMLHRYGNSLQPTTKHGEVGEVSKLSVGMRVKFAAEDSSKSVSSTMIGTLRYVGNLSSGNDEWAGIELDYPNGNCCGTLKETTYFRCKEDYGIFVHLSCVSSISTSKKPSPPTTSKKYNSTTASPRRKSSVAQSDFVVGDRVLVAGSMIGTVRFVGQTQFASGVWCGVEVNEEGPGRNNGSVGGISYFRCPPCRGVFAPPSKISHHADDLSNSKPDESFVVEWNSSSKPLIDSFTSLNIQQNSIKVKEQSQPKSHEISSSTSKVSKSASSTPEISRNHRGNTDGRLRSAESLTSNQTARKSPCLRSGLRVDVRGMKQTAVVKFVGHTNFATGLWVGLDLGSARGRNDGSVEGRRYFSCQPGHGIMLRPSRVAHRGISGDKMLPPHLETT